ncbi:ParB/RepB/Spo0J family partition protein [Candidatus Saccharibacteria bacterium]|nr:ParB/RepB/Spo0J family partition protein [Candidatus Saccharibacteria bacterium]
MAQPKSGKSGLGRGFDSLIPTNFDSSLLVDEQDRVQKLLISDILPNEGQPRRSFDAAQLSELAHSIKEHGILQPVVVRQMPDGTYSIVAGERRWRAAQIAGLDRIPAIVRTMEELQQLEIALVENVQRVDLSPLEQALSIQRLHDQFSIAYGDIALRLGKALATVTNIVRLLQLPDDARQALEQKQISEGHARAILSLKDMPDKQTELLQFIVKNKWSVRQAEQFAVACKKNTASTTTAKQQTQKVTPETRQLSKYLGVPVSIRRTAKGGKLELGFTSDEELEKILARLKKA